MRPPKRPPTRAQTRAQTLTPRPTRGRARAWIASRRWGRTRRTLTGRASATCLQMSLCACTYLLWLYLLVLWLYLLGECGVGRPGGACGDCPRRSAAAGQGGHCGRLAPTPTLTPTLCLAGVLTLALTLALTLTLTLALTLTLTRTKVDAVGGLQLQRSLLEKQLEQQRGVAAAAAASGDARAPALQRGSSSHFEQVEEASLRSYSHLLNT